MNILSSNMLAVFHLPEFISEYLRLYGLAVAFAILVAIYFFVRRLPGGLRSMRAASWPIAQGIVERINVNTVSGQALGELAYSYVAEGERYSGYLLLQFADEQDAWDSIGKLKAQAIFVRYKLGNPSCSTVRKADQSFSLGGNNGNLIARLLTRHVLEIIDLSTWRDLANRLGARNWPVIKGRVEYGSVAQHRDSETWFLLPNYTAEVGYSYSISGEYYSGHIERSFFRESSAQTFVENLKGKGAFVRYNRSSPEISVLRKSDQPVLQHA